MASFAIGEAIGSGLKVIRRKPLAMVVWAGAYILLLGIPYLLIMGPLLPDLIGFYQGAADSALNGGAPDTERLMALQGRMLGTMPLVWLLSLVTFTVLVGAIYRAVLTPQDDRFFYLRLSRQELWLGLTLLAFVMFYVVLILVTVIPVAVIFAVIASVIAGVGAQSGPLALVAPLLMLAIFAVVFWILLRLSMAFPMSFAQGRFVLFESWAFTKGHAWKMFLTALALWVVLVLMEIALAIPACIVLAGAVGGDLHNLLVMPPEQILRLLAPALVVIGLVGSVIGMAAYTVMIAPWASIYAQLTADEVAV